MSARDIVLVSRCLNAIAEVLHAEKIKGVGALEERIAVDAPPDPPFTAELKEALKKLDAYEKVFVEQNKAINTLQSQLRSTLDAKGDMRLMLNATFAAFAHMAKAAEWPCWRYAHASLGAGCFAVVQTPHGALARVYEDPKEAAWVEWMEEDNGGERCAQLAEVSGTEHLLSWLEKASSTALFEVKKPRGRPPRKALADDAALQTQSAQAQAGNQHPADDANPQQEQTAPAEAAAESDEIDLGF